MNNQPAAGPSLARIIAAVTNPAVLSILMLLIISFSKTGSLSQAEVQTIALIGLLVVVPLIFVFLRTASLPDKNVYRTDPTLFLKRHPLDIMILGIVCGSSSVVVLKLLSAPAPMLAALVSLLVVSFLVAVINLFYRASFHLAAIAVLVYMAVVIWGLPFLFLGLVIPPIAWAKYKLHDHTFLQMIFGICVAVAVTSIIIHLM
jgi:hypothetical protein